MTELIVRRVRFDFDKPVPFLWNPANPVFSVAGNTLSVLAVGFERFIVAAVREAIPHIADPAVVAEANAFLRQEAQHTSAHQQHVRALIRAYPGLQTVLDEVLASYESLSETTSLPFKLAYIANIEATFTPAFTLVLNNEKTLFRPGDDRIASLFLWHFVEEIEHRSSALLIYDAVVADKWYRMRALPAVIRHLTEVNTIATRGFRRYIPAAECAIAPQHRYRRALRNAVARVAPFISADPAPAVPSFLGTVTWREKLVALKGVLASQLPGHDPQVEDLPRFAARWFARYEAGEDVVHWYWSERNRDTARAAPTVAE